jgi:hypothetical protein
MPQPTLSDSAVDDEIAKDWQSILAGETPSDTETPDDDTPGGPGEPAPGGEGGDAPTGDAPPADGQRAEGDRPRDENGRFKPERRYKEPKPAAKAPGAEGAEGAQPGQQPQAAGEPGQQPAPGQQPRDVTRPPSTWSPKERAAWATIPPDARAAIHRREADFMSGQAQLMPDATFGREMSKTLEPFKLFIETEGATAPEAVHELLRSAYVLRTGTPQQKYGTLANIAHRYGLDLRAFAPRPQVGPNGQPLPQQQQPQPQQFRDPRVDELLRSIQTQAQQKMAAEQQETEGFVTRWMNEADAQGQPKRPYVGDVINEMSAMIPQLKEADPTLTHAQALEAAYERATWAHPEIRALLQQAQQTQANAQRRSESQQRVASARRGASVNVPRRGSLPPKPQTGSMEDTIADEARRLGLISS